MTRPIRQAALRNRLVRAVVALSAAAALFLIGLITPGSEAAGPYPFSQLAEIRFVTTDLCTMGTLGTSIGAGDSISFTQALQSIKYVSITSVGRCVSTKPLNPPPASNPGDADIQIGTELFNYATVATSTGYGTKLTTNLTRTQTAPFDMMVESTSGARTTNGEVVAGSEVFTYDTKTATSFHITARAQRNSQAADHNCCTNTNAERVYATPAISARTVSVETTLGTTITAAAVPAFTITVGTTTGTATSGVVLIDDERLNYTVVDGTHLSITGRAASKSTAAQHDLNAKVLIPRNPPFDLEVGDTVVEAPLDGSAPNGPAGTSHTICLGTEGLTYDPSDTATVGDGLSGISDVIHVTARSLNVLDCGRITPLAAEGQPNVGTTIRDTTRVQLLGRALPEYDFGTPTTAAAHNSPDAVNSPSSFNRCIGRSDATGSGPATVVSRTRCYSRLINPPSPPGNENGTGPYYVSTNPLTDPFTFISQSDGTFNDTTNGVLQTTLNVFSLGHCIAFGSLHVQVVTTVQADKTAGNTDYGSFRINVWSNDPTCSGTPDYVVGATDALAGQSAGTNFSTTPLADNSDIDGDGCSDYREVGGNNLVFPPSGEGAGGQRDPFNPYDFYDINHDGVININTDILGVASSFGPSNGPSYLPTKDRGATIGPFSWNRPGPDSTININDDVLGVAKQFGHSCTGAAHAHSTYMFGAHPTALTVAVASGTVAPFAMSVGTTATFPKAGQLLVDSETLTYNQKAACGGGFAPATQFCITARGTAAQHNSAAAVYSKIVTTLPAAVAAPPTTVAPFAMSVASTANFTATGHLLVGSELLTYDQSSGSCPGLVAATQFCIIARGVQPPPAAHAISSLVWQMR